MTKIFRQTELAEQSRKRMEEFDKKYTSNKPLSNNALWTVEEIGTYNEKEGEESWLDPKKSKKDKLRVCSKALHPEFSYPLIEVAELSLEKGYKPLNWLDKDSKVTVTYLVEAAQRHLDKIKMGIDINTEERALDGAPATNQPWHAAQVAYNMLMLCRQMEEGVEIDDRLYKDGVRK